MFGMRLDITAELELLTPLHLGTGEVETFDSIERDDQQTKQKVAVPVACVMRDAGGLPTIPGASVKGVLRAATDPAEPGLADLFGPETGQSLHQGRLTARRMRYLSAGQSAMLAAGMPYATAAHSAGRTFADLGLFVAARTAIDPGLGVADEGKLFHQQLVVPGARFRMELSLRLDGDVEAARRSEACLIRALAALTRGEGIAFGHGQSLGQGRLRLHRDTLQGQRLAIDKTSGALADVDSAATTRALRQAVADASVASVETIERYLVGRGPFLVNDSSIVPRPDSGDPRLNAQRQGAGKNARPLLPGSTVVGALRARAGWLSQLRWSDSRAGDNRDRILAKNDPAARRVLGDRAVTSAIALTPTERLFGVTGWRGLLRVARIDCVACAGFESITSVRLDRFSMAPIDGALFTSRAAIDPVFRVTLELERRGGFPSDDDRKLLEALLAELREEGLMLGHATSRGYGWFAVAAAWSPTIGGEPA